MTTQYAWGVLKLQDEFQRLVNTPEEPNRTQKMSEVENLLSAVGESTTNTGGGPGEEQFEP